MNRPRLQLGVIVTKVLRCRAPRACSAIGGGRRIGLSRRSGSPAQATTIAYRMLRTACLMHCAMHRSSHVRRPAMRTIALRPLLAVLLASILSALAPAALARCIKNVADGTPPIHLARLGDLLAQNP